MHYYIPKHEKEYKYTPFYNIRVPNYNTHQQPGDQNHVEGGSNGERKSSYSQTTFELAMHCSKNVNHVEGGFNGERHPS